MSAATLPTPDRFALYNDGSGWCHSGRSGQDYPLTVTPTGLACACEGFARRRTCRHTRQAEAILTRRPTPDAELLPLPDIDDGRRCACECGGTFWAEHWYAPGKGYHMTRVCDECQTRVVL